MTEARRILIVEDEMIVALFIEDLLDELGHKAVGTISRLDEAIARADNIDFDMAILDVHLQGKEVFPFAELLAAKGVPFVFATGYGERGIPERLRSAPTLQKPFRPEELADMIVKLTASKP
jgi:two-component SAPR family response regulator